MRILKENTNYVNYLIELSQSGRKPAFFDLCEINLRNIFTTTYRLTNDYEMSKKITIKTFTDAWRDIKNYDYKISFVLWLKDIAIRNSLQYIDRLPKTESIKIEEGESKLERLERLIMSLDFERRIIFVLHDMEGYSYEEIADFLGYDLIDEIKTKLMETREYLISLVCK